jgi:hypothetical protein
MNRFAQSLETTLPGPEGKARVLGVARIVPSSYAVTDALKGYPHCSFNVFRLVIGKAVGEGACLTGGVPGVACSGWRFDLQDFAPKSSEYSD